jgi:hypothetical protein
MEAHACGPDRIFQGSLSEHKFIRPTAELGAKNTKTTVAAADPSVSKKTFTAGNLTANL